MSDHKQDRATLSRETSKTPFCVKVWDLPTRLFHWALVGLVAASYVTGKRGGMLMGYHEWSGVAILVLVLFRIAWGGLGGGESRFSAFVRGPSAVCRYARALWQGGTPRHLGHNPLGGWSVLLMLLAVFVQAGTGLFANDDILTEGPLAHWVSGGVSDRLTALHHLNQTLLAGLIAIHIAAVLFHLLVKKENLIAPMVTGIKAWDHEVRPTLGHPCLAAGLLAGVAAVVYGMIY